MSNARALFPGAMGPDGFISCFDHLIDPAALRRTLILKGGPGVGKSTFLRRLHAALCAQGEEATLYFCSGDPDSLDAVAVPHIGLLALDGTAPHIVDPAIPGARDGIVNLGVCLNEAAMRPRLPQIQAIMADHAACSRRARACLASARAVAQDCAALLAASADEAHWARMTRALVQAALCGEGTPCDTPRVRPIITDAVTPKGELCMLTDNSARRVIRLHGHWAADLTPALQQVSRAALAAGYAVEEHLCPTVPGRLLHVSIPALSTLVTTAETLSCEQSFDFTACVPPGALLRHECALEQGHATVRTQRNRAVSALAQAKQLHDELETFYVPSMDFARWQRILDDTLTTLRADA